MDDLIQRMRALMAEIEHRLGSDQSVSLPSAYPATDTWRERKQDQQLNDPGYCLPKAIDDRKARETSRPTDYTPRDPMHEAGFDPEDFIGTGDYDR